MQSSRFCRTVRKTGQRHTVAHFTGIFHIRHNKFQFPGIIQNNFTVSHCFVPVDTGYDQGMIGRCSEHGHLHAHIFPYQIIAHIQIPLQIPFLCLFFRSIAGTLGKQIISVKYPALVFTKLSHRFFCPVSLEPFPHQVNT